MKRVFLELGGKSAFVLLDDGDLAMAALVGAYAATSHSGQGCAITSRLVVPRARYDEVGRAGARRCSPASPYGDPTDPANMMGPLINARQREKVAGYVDRAVADGAKAVIGGRAPEHLPQRLLLRADVARRRRRELRGRAGRAVRSRCSWCCRTTATTTRSRIANNSIFGLSGSVLSADRERARSPSRGGSAPAR